jgi:catechol 2,3-dioxygenase-like lactoylglutathione lyase family enzyme
MIDHVGFPVADYERAKRFYTTTLAPLGYDLVMEVGSDQTESGAAACGFGPAGNPVFWIGADGALADRVHVAVAAKDRASVDAFYQAALAAGARDNGAPGVRPHYHPNYYSAFVIDLDGHNIEAVCHTPA